MRSREKLTAVIHVLLADATVTRIPNVSTPVLLAAMTLAGIVTERADGRGSTIRNRVESGLPDWLLS
mgnify:CR=1 FL=1